MEEDCTGTDCSVAGAGGGGAGSTSMWGKKKKIKVHLSSTCQQIYDKPPNRSQV